MSYPTLEVEHLRSLDQRLLDVFTTAKSLRKPEVCGFKLKCGKGNAVLVSEYITSYRLKTVFLHLVQLFLKSDTLSLGKMVLMVYEHLEGCLKRGRLPLFFDPEVDVLAGSKTSTEDSIRVAMTMTKLVRYMYRRDFQRDEKDDLVEEKRLVATYGENLRKIGVID
jgi:hypothetical protein